MYASHDFHQPAAVEYFRAEFKAASSHFPLFDVEELSVLVRKLGQSHTGSQSVTLHIPMHGLSTGNTSPALATMFSQAERVVPMVNVKSSAEIDKSVDAVSPSEKLTQIRSALKLSVSDLAKLFGVSRPTIYAWLEGTEPKRDAARQITDINIIATKVGELKISKMEHFIHRPIFGGESLFDRLYRGASVLTDLQVIGMLAAKEATVRGKAGDRGGVDGRLTEIDEHFLSFPVMNERAEG